MHFLENIFLQSLTTIHQMLWCVWIEREVANLLYRSMANPSIWVYGIQLVRRITTGYAHYLILKLMYFSFVSRWFRHRALRMWELGRWLMVMTWPVQYSKERGDKSISVHCNIPQSWTGIALLLRGLGSSQVVSTDLPVSDGPPQSWRFLANC